ncbi:MAG: sigma 54-interacting transcriptional regulator [Myxococcales bacterium]|nr:sigma 54-interacting transcriptional regulator [Myxococcales bacterium]
MATEHLTDLAGTSLAPPGAPRAFLVVHVDLPDRGSSVVDLHDGIDVTFGRSRGAVVTVDHPSVSRLHARVRRTGDVIEVEDLGSRNGTRVNGDKLEGVRRLVRGDELVLGPITAVVSVTSGLNTGPMIAEASAGEARLVAEIDRAVRYRRPVMVAMIRIAHDDGLDLIARSLRPMDLLAEQAGDEYLLILPELDRTSGKAALARLLDGARGLGAEAKAVSLVAPEDGTSPHGVISTLRTAMRTGTSRRATTAPTEVTGPIIIDSSMRKLYAMIERIADASMTVLILGETGVGKELVTEAIHRHSRRRTSPLIKLNCAALTETLLESELFGHERGAFTGADRKKIGFFEAADGGTLFLDEIGEMPPSLQAKLLRVLERRVVTRVGGTAEIPVDVRVVCATHRDLDGEVRVGRFRQDLLYRVAGFTLMVPPLRDRTIEIMPLAEHFARHAAERLGRAAPVITDEARAALTTYAWPGNVRELENAIERALVLCDDQVRETDLPDHVRDATPANPTSAAGDVRGQIADVERAAIVAALAAEGDNQTRAARRLGLSRRALIYKMEKYGLKAPPRSDEP